MQSNPNEAENRASKSPWSYVAIGATIWSTIAITTLIGVFLDEHFKTLPIFTVAGCLLGIGSSIGLLIKIGINK